MLKYRKMSYLLLFAGLAAGGCSNTDIKDQLQKNEGIPVNVVKLQKEKTSVPVHVSGNISASRESRLSFKTGGIIESVFADEGDRVNKGDNLAILDLKEIKEQVNQSHVALNKARRDYDRTKALYSDTVTTLEQLQNARSAMDVATANVNIAEYNLKFSSIKAPSDGVILKKFFEEDEIVGAGMPVFYFASAEEAWQLLVGVSDKDIVKLKLGDKAKITADAYPNKNLDFIVSNIANAPGQFTGLYEVELSLRNKNIELKHGFFAKGEIYPSEFKEYYGLPVNAIQEGLGKMVTFYSVNVEDPFAIKQEASIISINSEKVFINTANFNEDMMVIVENQKELKHLDKVKIINKDMLIAKKH